MKRKIFSALISLIFSVAVLNVICDKNVDNICINQVGAGVWAYGSHSGSTVASWTGGIIASAGGTAAGYGLAGIVGLAVVSNPVGWITGGIVLGL
jgi:hypothetical protein